MAFTPRLTLRLENPDAIQKTASSKVASIGGFKWRMEVEKSEANNGDFELRIYCNESEMNYLWLCNAQFTISVRQGNRLVLLGKQSGSSWENNLEYKYEQIFFNGNFWSWSGKFLPIAAGDSTVVLEFELVNLGQNTLGRNMPPLDTNLFINYAGKEEAVGVNKFLLAGISNYFRNLFFGEWAERNISREGGQQGKKFSIGEEPDFDIGAFKLMLNSAQLMGWMVDGSKFLNAQLALQILKMSIKYDLPMLQDYCEKFLLKADDFPTMELLGLADELGIRVLKQHCLDSITPSGYAMNIGRNTEIRSQLAEQTRQELDVRLQQAAQSVHHQYKRRKLAYNWENGWGGGNDNDEFGNDGFGNAGIGGGGGWGNR